MSGRLGELEHDDTGPMVIKRRKDRDVVPPDPAFDRWVSRQLHKAYDEVLVEDVPPSLLELVERWQANGSIPEAVAKTGPGVKKRPEAKSGPVAKTRKGRSGD